LDSLTTKKLRNTKRRRAGALQISSLLNVFLHPNPTD
jgi:hypothetical protein